MSDAREGVDAGPGAEHHPCPPRRRGQGAPGADGAGRQDAWRPSRGRLAFNAAHMAEHLSMEHTRPGILKVIPRVGDALLTNRRRPILTVVEDTSGR